MRVLLAGELTAGGLAGSLREGLERNCDLALFDPYGASSQSIDHRGLMTRARRLRARSRASARLIDQIERTRPDWVLLIKGRGLGDAIERIQQLGSRVACYYPDNPFWRGGDADALDRLAKTDLALVWSDRLRRQLQTRGIIAATVPFGYDQRWFAPHDPEADRDGIVFLGTWSPRRERYLAALEGLPLTVCGSGWSRARSVEAATPIYEGRAGALLARAAIGINLLHPQCAGAHNMRTREIVASGAAQLCDPGRDGTPLVNGHDCEWFDSPADLRIKAELLLNSQDRCVTLAMSAQKKTLCETYAFRATQIVERLEAA